MGIHRWTMCRVQETARHRLESRPESPKFQIRSAHLRWDVDVFIVAELQDDGGV